MKNLYIALAFVVATATTNSFSQSKETKTADKLFNQFEYVKASEQYLKLAATTPSPYVFKQLGDSYYNMFNTAEATKWYAKATATDQNAETYYRYAQMLKATGKYEQAGSQMQKFAAKAPNDARAKAYLANPNYISKLQTQTKGYDVKKLDISSEQADFGAVLNNGNVYFASARNTARKKYGWTAEPYLDLYQANYNTDGTITNATTVTAINSRWHDGPATLSKDGNTMYFASESYKENKYEKDSATKDKKSQVSLFKASKQSTGWSNIEPLPFNSKDYSTSNPSVSQDGKTLYFSSNMPGSMGGRDIWKTAINADGSYGKPENLGAKVNTEGDESFPSISDDNKTLYFASSGRQGFGGLDVYELDLTNANAQASNLGKPVNTEKDDFAFTFNQEKNVGFLSSNREKSDDIYLVNPVCKLNVNTVVTNAKTGAIIANATVTLLDDKKAIIATETSNERGEVSFGAECEKAYTLSAEKSGYETGSFAVAKISKSATTKIDAKLVPIEAVVTEKEIILSPIYFEYDKSNITEDGAFELDKLVAVMNENPKLVVYAKSHTDNRGSDKYNERLSDARAKATVQYIISKGVDASRISGKGMGESEPKNDCKDACTETDHAKNRRSEFLIVK